MRLTVHRSSSPKLSLILLTVYGQQPPLHAWPASHHCQEYCRHQAGIKQASVMQVTKATAHTAPTLPAETAC